MCCRGYEHLKNLIEELTALFVIRTVNFNSYRVQSRS